MGRVLLALVAALALAPVAQARVITGVSGGTSLEPYAGQTGAKPEVFGFFTKFGGSWEYIFDAAERTDTTPMLHIGTNDGYGTPERISPLGIAEGKGDGYLIRLNRRMGSYGKLVYVRLMAEMNQANNAYSAFDKSGRPRGAAHSTASFKLAWRRTALILRGGPLDRIDARLKAMGLPAVKGTDEDLPTPAVELLWIPQTRGSPDIRANLPQAYWPGSRYVDWVGTDFYSKFPRFDWLGQFYDRFKGKPFAFGEWALWGSDDAGFVRRLFGWVHSHKRVKLMLYNQGALTNGPFRLNHYPSAKAEIRRQLERL